MKFINPKIDLAFKKIFGTTENKNILINFLNAILYEAQPVIEDLDIIHPQEGVETLGVKDTYLDIKAKINDDKIALIELQLLHLSSFGNRFLYNGGKTYSRELTGEERNERLKTVISLKIADFEMFANQTDVISRFVFKQKEQKTDYPDTEIELVFVEMPKFNKQWSELKTAADQWIYFIKNSSILDRIPEDINTNSEVYKAFELAIEDNFDGQELKALENQEMWIQNLQGAINVAREDATKNAQLSLILRQIVKRLGTIDAETENRIRQLSLEDLEKLGDAVLDFKNMSDLTDWLPTYSG
ncbi:MAG: Rpn family recombination-promoting nuclease/putative transposase [Microcoleus anatoxicus]|uniref:Rpn family recombination-promoting nuclease/putative transposase n=1 Tax=Microcoleus anatoxicus TaxID=2705319 RepID=UPI00366EC4DD